MKLNNEELHLIVGGASQLSSSLINSIAKMINTILDLGRSVGSSIKYAISGKSCKVK